LILWQFMDARRSVSHSLPHARLGNDAAAGEASEAKRPW